MEDLVSSVDPDPLFRLLRALRKISVAKRATVIVTLNKPHERRGLVQLFDDVLVFTEEGVSYFGPTRRLKEYCSLIGSPCPSNVHVAGTHPIHSFLC
jgi:ABC-type multidrug transport system ATPase subunit